MLARLLKLLLINKKMAKNIEELVKHYREEPIRGVFLDFIPLKEFDFENVVNLRNKDRNRFSFNQEKKLTVEDQKNWYKNYLERNNDIYWAIHKKDGTFIGATRVYGIDKNEDICEQGSFMIDEDYADEAPYAVESLVMVYDFIFNVLGIGRAINQDREDNKTMNNLSKKIGFEYVKTVMINGAAFNYLVLTKDNYLIKREKFAKIIDYWRTR